MSIPATKLPQERFMYSFSCIGTVSNGKLIQRKHCHFSVTLISLERKCRFSFNAFFKTAPCSCQPAGFRLMKSSQFFFWFLPVVCQVKLREQCAMRHLNLTSRECTSKKCSREARETRRRRRWRRIDTYVEMDWWICQATTLLVVDDIVVELHVETMRNSNSRLVWKIGWHSNRGKSCTSSGSFLGGFKPI